MTKRPTHLGQVDEDVAQAFKIVASRSAYAEMSVDREVASGALERLILLVADVLTGLRVAVE